jgi:dTDP-4-amino-4,6-dideoxygalactose transaminase
MEIAYREVLSTLDGQLCPRRSITPPNRLATSNLDLLSAFLSLWKPEDSLELLRHHLQAITGCRSVLFAPSCRSAIAQVLSVLPQSEVVMPAFTCPVVRDAVTLAGKRIIYVDLAKQSINATSREFDAEAKPGRILLPTHLFGIPTDIESICELAAERECVTIEDAAAVFDVKEGDQLLGTFADIGVFSFERSKRVPAFSGGVIILNNEELIDREKLASNPLHPKSASLPFRDLLFAFLFNLATAPWLYGRVTLPRLLKRYAQQSPADGGGDEAAAISSRFYRQDLHPIQAKIILRTFERIDAVKAHIKQLVNVYEAVLEGSGIRSFITDSTDRQGVLRFPVTVPGLRRRDVLEASLRRGIYLETNYEEPLPPRSEWAKYPNAVWAAEHLLLLPLYGSLPVEAATMIARNLVEIASRAHAKGDHLFPVR